MESDLTNFTNNIKPVEIKPAKLISPNDMTREQIYDYIQKNQPVVEKRSTSLTPEVLGMASELRQRELKNKQIASQVQARKQATQVRRNVPGR
jgi:hypothetical protein